MANFVIRAAMELTGIAYADASAIQGQTAKSAAAKSAAAKPAAAKPAAAAKAAPKPSASKTSAAAKKPDAKKAAVTGKSTAKPGAKTATKTTPAPASIAGQAPQVARRRPGKPSNAELAGQQVVHPPQSKAKVPETIREFKPKYESAKGQTPPASLTRRFFEQEKKWGYDVTIASRQVGRLLFDHDGVWSLTPTDERLAERNVKVTIHANPISAFVRVTNGWSRALTSQPAAAAA
jgi:hypothetical protein